VGQRRLDLRFWLGCWFGWLFGMIERLQTVSDARFSRVNGQQLGKALSGFGCFAVQGELVDLVEGNRNLFIMPRLLHFFKKFGIRGKRRFGGDRFLQKGFRYTPIPGKKLLGMKFGVFIYPGLELRQTPAQAQRFAKMSNGRYKTILFEVAAHFVES